MSQLRKSIAWAALAASVVGCGGGVNGSEGTAGAVIAKSLTCVAQQPGGSSSDLRACTSGLGQRIDDIVQPFMARNGISAVSVAVVKDGVLWLERGYGHLDRAGKVALPANALFPTASIVKPVTAAAVHQLVRDGKLALSDHVFCTGNNAPCWIARAWLPADADPRAGEITIAQLLDHKGGWDSDVSGDPLLEEPLIQQQTGLSAAPQRSDVIRYVMARPLDFAPGQRSAYANFGYLLLGQIIDQAAPEGYVRYVQAKIMAPLGVAAPDFDRMRSLLNERGPREPYAITAVQAPSVFFPGTMVTGNDGAVRADNWMAAGTSISTARAMALFAGRYGIPSGLPLAGATNNGGHTGAIPGAATLVRQLPSGASYAVMMNKLDETDVPEEQSYQMQVLRQVDAAIQASGL